MQRPFISFSFTQLEAEFKKASTRRDGEVLSLLEYELTHRHKNSKAEPLRAKVSALKNTLPRQTDLFSVTGAPARAPPAKQIHTKAAGRKRSKFKPTGEQQEAIVAFLQGKSLKINAFAGTGKTSTLQLLANATGLKGQYIAFNRDIVADASNKFPDTVDCSTSHRLAFRAAPFGYKQDKGKLTTRCTAKQVVEALDLKWRQFGGKHGLTPDSQGYLYLETIRRYAQSSDDEIQQKHVPMLGALRVASDSVVEEVSHFAIEGARKVWTRMLTERDPLPLGHDGYLKLWGLSRPYIPADFILLDEAQDTNPVILDVLQRQKAQMVYVGDRYQQIYEWRGAVNAMETIATDASTFLTTSFRFGDAIADLATKMLVMLGEERPVHGNPNIQSRLGVAHPTAVLARTNASTIAAIIEALEVGKKPHLVGDNTEIMEMLRGVQMLKEGKPSQYPDFFGFKNWAEVVEHARGDEGAHLVTFVNLVESRGERQLMWALSRTVEADKSDLVISTAHKAKGREWKSVRLMDDFLKTKPTADKAPGPDLSELRLLYVALTRAKEALDLPSTILSFIERGVMPAQERPVVQTSNRPSMKSDVGHSRAVVHPSPKQGHSERPLSALPQSPVKPERRGIFRWLLGK